MHFCDIDACGGVKLATTKKGRRRFPYGSVYPRRDGGKYTIDFRTPTGERIQKVVDAWTWQDAHEALKQAVYEAHFGKHDREEKKSITFIARAQEHLQTYAVTKRSCQTDEYRLRKLMEFFRDIELRKITPSMIRKYVALRLKEGKSESTVNREIALLKTIFNVALEDGYIEENPAKKIKKFSELDTERDRVLSKEEEERLLSELAAHVRPVVLTALHTGLRLSKVLGLRWSDVDMDKRFIKVERTKSKRTRFIPINSVLYGELECLKECRNDNCRVFPFKSVRTAFDNACDRASVEGFTFHDLRRTFGTRMLEKGVDIVTISKLYGHSSVLVTQRYLHPKDKLSVEAVELLAERHKNRPAPVTNW
jgi:integrase